PGLPAIELGVISWPLASRRPCKHKFDPGATLPRLTPAPMVKFSPPTEISPAELLVAALKLETVPQARIGEIVFTIMALGLVIWPAPLRVAVKHMFDPVEIII